MNEKNIKMLSRILLSAILLIVAYVTPVSEEFKLALFLLPYLIIGWDVLWDAIKNIGHGQIFDENFLMAIATIGAFFIHEYPEAVFVMLFFQIGEFFQSCAVEKSRKSIGELMDIRPDYANLEINGEYVKVSPEKVKIGDIIIIKAGEKVPLDGVVIEGESSLNTTALTGESLPRDIKVGDEVISGCVNMRGLLKVKVLCEEGESTVSKMLELVEHSSSNKASAENFITRFARYYTPVVVIAAALLAILPPLLFGGIWSEWLNRAMIFLVVSCPCALVISVPLSFFGGIGGAARRGILFKGSNYLEALAKADTVVFDKTGTLTRGNFEVTNIHPEKISENELLFMAVAAEVYSDHPISRSLKCAYKNKIDKSLVTDVEEISGKGIKAKIKGTPVYVGNDKLMQDIKVDWHACRTPGTIVHVAIKDEYAGHIVISDEIKPSAGLAVSLLKKSGIRKIVMLTGDLKKVADSVAKQVGISEVHSELLPADKVKYIENMIDNKNENGKVVFVGDGINDAPVLSRANVGVAMGAMGSDAAIEAADVVIMNDKPEKVALAIKISKKTLRIVWQNIAFALGIKAIVLVCGALGFTSMWAAVFADVGVSIIAILNAIRALRIRP
ncbi:MAG: heavy metal translocating P-type ATPase [Oscillospiraceae bacterium]